MAKGKDERHNPNRRVTKEALGNRYAEIGVGFGDDPRVQKDIAEQQAMWNGIDAAGIAESYSEADENMHEPNDDIGSYDGQDYDDGGY